MQHATAFTPDQTLTWSPERTRSNITGICPFSKDAKWHRFKLNIGSGGGGTHVHGIQPYAKPLNTRMTINICPTHLGGRRLANLKAGFCGGVPEGWQPVQRGWPAFDLPVRRGVSLPDDRGRDDYRCGDRPGAAVDGSTGAACAGGDGWRSPGTGGDRWWSGAGRHFPAAGRWFSTAGRDLAGCRE